MNYSEKLKDPRWQKKRLEIMQRDGFKCVSCGDDSRTLHVHHCFYVSGREPWEYLDETLITICDSCRETVDVSGSKSNAWSASWELAAFIQCHHNLFMRNQYGMHPTLPVLGQMVDGMRLNGSKINIHRLFETLILAGKHGVFTDEKIKEIETEIYHVLKRNQPNQPVD